jgi:hypothetical protein
LVSSLCQGWLVRPVQRSTNFHLLAWSNASTQALSFAWSNASTQALSFAWSNAEHSRYTIPQIATTKKSTAKDYIIFVLTKAPAVACCAKHTR